MIMHFEAYKTDGTNIDSVSFVPVFWPKDVLEWMHGKPDTRTRWQRIRDKVKWKIKWLLSLRVVSKWDLE